MKKHLDIPGGGRNWNSMPRHDRLALLSGAPTWVYDAYADSGGMARWYEQASGKRIFKMNRDGSAYVRQADGEWTQWFGACFMAEQPHEQQTDVTTVPAGTIQKMLENPATPSPSLQAAVDRAHKARIAAANISELTDPGEIRTTSPTGGQKGVKLARFDLIPPKALWKIAEGLGKGAEKYADNNWRLGYAWSNSYAALDRHIKDFWGGEDIDPRTGMPHLALAGCHILFLLEFMRIHPEYDDRPSTFDAKNAAAADEPYIRAKWDE